MESKIILNMFGFGGFFVKLDPMSAKYQKKMPSVYMPVRDDVRKAFDSMDIVERSAGYQDDELSAKMMLTILRVSHGKVSRNRLQAVLETMVGDEKIFRRRFNGYFVYNLKGQRANEVKHISVDEYYVPVRDDVLQVIGNGAMTQNAITECLRNDTGRLVSWQGMRDVLDAMVKSGELQPLPGKVKRYQRAQK